MDIVLVGAGNTATVLGRALKQAGHHLVQVAGRNPPATAALAAELGAEACTAPAALYREAALYLLAVPDGALPGMARQWQLPNRLLAHTAGAVPLQVLQGAAAAYGVLYPLQSLRKEITTVPDIPLLVDGNTPAAADALQAIAQSISSRVGRANDAQRLHLHLAAVLVNNFTNHLYALAESYCQANGVDFQYLYPIIRETATRLEQFSPRQVQTGPALRHDAGTIGRHLELLKGDTRLTELYALFTKSIEEGHKKTGQAG